MKADERSALTNKTQKGSLAITVMLPFKFLPFILLLYIFLSFTFLLLSISACKYLHLYVCPGVCHLYFPEKQIKGSISFIPHQPSQSDPKSDITE